MLAAFSFCLCGSLDHAEYVVLAHDQIVFVVELDLSAGILAKQHTVSLFDVQRLALAAIEFLACPGGDDLALLRLLSGTVGNDDAPADLLSFFDPPDDHAILKRAYTCHMSLLLFNELKLSAE